MLLITEKKKNTQKWMEIQTREKKQTHLTHLASAYLPALTAVLSLPCLRDVTSKISL